MTDIDELLARLRKLEAVELEPRFSRSVQRAWSREAAGRNSQVAAGVGCGAGDSGRLPRLGRAFRE